MPVIARDGAQMRVSEEWDKGPQETILVGPVGRRETAGWKKVRGADKGTAAPH
jgi:hypothetical protein